MQLRTCFRFGAVSSGFVAFLMLIANSWSVLHRVSVHSRKGQETASIGPQGLNVIEYYGLGMPGIGHGSHDGRFFLRGVVDGGRR